MAENQGERREGGTTCTCTCKENYWSRSTRKCTCMSMYTYMYVEVKESRKDVSDKKGREEAGIVYMKKVITLHA